MLSLKQIEDEIVELQDLGWFFWTPLSVVRLLELREVNSSLFARLFRSWNKTPYGELLGFKPEPPRKPPVLQKRGATVTRASRKRFVALSCPISYNKVAKTFGVSGTHIAALMRSVAIYRVRGCFAYKTRARKR